MKGGNPERGAAIVEFALVVVLLLTLMVGIFEGGRLFLLQAQLSSAARDAAREMAITGNVGDAQAAATSIFSDGYGWTVNQACATPPSPGSNASITLTFSTTPLTGLVPNTFNLTGTGVMRCNG